MLMLLMMIMLMLMMMMMMDRENKWVDVNERFRFVRKQRSDQLVSAFLKRAENDQFLPGGQELLNCCPATVALV
ncbi:hypothetical protein EVAR_70909_1 [Eumeta japonica]|uniref:Uncharacterized protein n=1 Tax=Eumeta variegata TaxID=151549 RepID=A0A4C2AG74_EUMVA|nr:hypothetical protein EVAR_70909_1 [Eumeta japonica]